MKGRIEHWCEQEPGQDKRMHTNKPAAAGVVSLWTKADAETWLEGKTQELTEHDLLVF